MDTFFAGYPDYTYDDSLTFLENFSALAIHRNWVPHKKAHTRAFNAFRDAMVIEFNQRFGTDEKDLAAWHNLCVVLGMPERELPASITQCKKAIKKKHVNLVDLLQARSGDEVHKFRSLAALQEYTFETEKYFPKRRAKAAGGLLKYLLRNM